VRSRAVSALGAATDAADDALLRRILSDSDPRVRANAVELLEQGNKTQFAPLLADKAKQGHHRERANAIKALQGMKIGQAAQALAEMLNDTRPDHRISGIWALRQMGFWRLLGEVGRIAKDDGSMRVRRYALAVLKSVTEIAQRQKEKAG